MKNKKYQVPILIKATQSVEAETWEEAIDKIAKTNLVDYKAIDNMQKDKIFPQTEISFTHWVEKYKPLKNPFTFFNSLNLLNFQGKEFYHYLHASYRGELEIKIQHLPNEVIWTLVNVNPDLDYNDPNEFRILSGYYEPDTKFPNGGIVDGYFITENEVSSNATYQIIYSRSY